jgi:hypothetical protein
MVMNDMVEDLSEDDIKTIVEANDNPKEPNEALKDAAIEHGAFGEVKENPGYIPFEKRGLNTRSTGLTGKTIESRTVKSKQVKKDTYVGGKGPLYNLRMGKWRKADSDKTT